MLKLISRKSSPFAAVIGIFAVISFLVPSAVMSAPSGACISSEGEFVGCVCNQAECDQLCDSANKLDCKPGSSEDHPCTEKTCPDDIPVNVEGTTGVFAPKKLQNPLGGANNIPLVVGRIIQVFTGVSGSLALLMFVWGGFNLMTSRGESAKVEKGKKAMLMAVAGLAIIFTAYAVLSLLFETIGAI